MQNAASWFRGLFQYGSWMMETLADACTEHGLADDPRIVFLFQHTVNARRIWLERVRDGAVHTDIHETLTIAQALERDAVDTEAWGTLLLEGGEEGLDKEITYANLSGTVFTQLFRDLVFHVINHTTHHMDEVSVRIRASGATPPPTDHVVYTRSLVSRA
ncbi:MAG: DinB family protein [Bacteroidetes bacterium]|nr:DinB family protein [Bacteroidota bacterium]